MWFKMHPWVFPIKWLALLCVLDYTFWSFLYSVFIGDCFKKNDAFDEENQYSTDVEKDRLTEEEYEDQAE